MLADVLIREDIINNIHTHTYNGVKLEDSIMELAHATSNDSNNASGYLGN
jgi:hypothetical protein